MEGNPTSLNFNELIIVTLWKPNLTRSHENLTIVEAKTAPNFQLGASTYCILKIYFYNSLNLLPIKWRACDQRHLNYGSETNFLQIQILETLNLGFQSAQITCGLKARNISRMEKQIADGK